MRSFMRSFTRWVNSGVLSGVQSVDVRGCTKAVCGSGASRAEFDLSSILAPDRTKFKVQAVAKGIDLTGKCAHAAEVDALDEQAVNAYIESVVRDAGGIDVAFNAIGPLAAEYGGGKNAAAQSPGIKTVRVCSNAAADRAPGTFGSTPLRSRPHRAGTGDLTRALRANARPGSCSRGSARSTHG